MSARRASTSTLEPRPVTGRSGADPRTWMAAVTLVALTVGAVFAAVQAAGTSDAKAVTFGPTTVWKFDTSVQFSTAADFTKAVAASDLSRDIAAGKYTIGTVDCGSCFPTGPSRDLVFLYASGVAYDAYSVEKTGTSNTFVFDPNASGTDFKLASQQEVSLENLKNSDLGFAANDQLPLNSDLFQPMWTSLDGLTGDPELTFDVEATTEAEMITAQPKGGKGKNSAHPGRVFVAPDNPLGPDGKPVGPTKPSIVIPEDWIWKPAENGNGGVFTDRKNSNNNVRIMRGSKEHPDGYVRRQTPAGDYLLPDGQRVTGPDGKPVNGKNAPETHVDIFFRGLIQWFPKLKSFPVFLLPGQEEMIRCGLADCPPMIQS